MIPTKQPPIVRFVYALPTMVVVIVQDMRQGAVLSIIAEDYDTPEIDDDSQYEVPAN